MDEIPALKPATWTPSLACRVDRVCGDFEPLLKAASKSDHWPALETYLADASESDRSTLLRELLGLELDYRRRAGQQPTPEAYLARFPEHGALVLELFQPPADTGAPPSTGPTAPPPQGNRRGAPRERQPEPAIPGYESLDWLGGGGMGVVYKAWQVRPGRVVALKMISTSSLVDPGELTSRFLIEAEAIGRLNHPHIVQIYEMGDHEGRLFFSMEFVEGGGLDKQIAGTPWAPRPAAELLEALARAIHYAHERGIVHRDLKPANVLVAPDGTPKITDFGLAKLLIGGKGETQSEAFIGTPSYMAPEQARGRARDVTPATDVWALGAILYALLAARPPFLGETSLEVLAQIVQEDPVPLTRLRSGVPKDLETICLKCLAKAPARRYASAGELAERLRLFLDGKPIPDRPPGNWERLARAARRRPILSAVVVASAALLLGLLGVVLWYNFRLQRDVRAKVAENEVQRLLYAAQEFVRKNDWPAADKALDQARGKIDSDSSLAGFRDEEARLRDEVRSGSSALQVRATARARARESLEFCHETLAQVFGARLEVGPNLKRFPTAPDRMRQALRLAKGPAADPNLDPREREEVASSCHELFVLLTYSLPPGRAADGALKQVVDLFAQARGLGTPPRAHYEQLAVCLTRLGREKEAEEARRRAARLRPGNSAADYFLEGLEYYRQRDFRAAIGAFYRAVGVQPDHFWARYCLGQSCQELGRYGEARDAFSACLTLQPDLPGAHVGYGYTYARERNLKAAEAVFDRAAKRVTGKQDRYGLYVMLGSARWGDGKPELAVGDFLEASRLCPTEVEAHLSLAYVYQQLGQWDKAAAKFRAVIRRAEGRPQVQADAYAELGRIEAVRAKRAAGPNRRPLYVKAVANCDEALKRAPNHPAAHRVQAEALLELGQYRAALSVYDRYLSLERPPGESLRDVYRGRGLARHKLKDYHGAIDDYTAAIQQDAKPAPDLYVHRGWARYFAHSWETALQDFEIALWKERAPRLVGHLAPCGAGPWPAVAALLASENGEAHSGRGNCRVMLGHYRQAIADADLAYQFRPEGPECTFNVACIFGLAVAKVKDDRKEPARAALAKKYTARAVALLREALALVRPEKQGRFWVEVVRPDPTLTAIHGSPEYLRLEREMLKGQAPPSK